MPEIPQVKAFDTSEFLFHEFDDRFFLDAQIRYIDINDLPYNRVRFAQFVLIGFLECFPCFLLKPHCRRFQRAFSGQALTQSKGYALDRFLQVIGVEHGQMRTIADTTHAADALLFIDAHNTPLIAIDGVGGAHVDAFATLVTHGGDKGIVVIEDSDGGIFAVLSFEKSSGAGNFAFPATSTNLLTDGEKFHRVSYPSLV